MAKDKDKDEQADDFKKRLQDALERGDKKGEKEENEFKDWMNKRW